MSSNNFITKYSANYNHDLFKVLKQLNSFEALLSWQKVLELKQKLVNLKQNKAFVVQLGECAEGFNQANSLDVNARVQLIHDFCKALQEEGSFLPSSIIKIGRIAGQYAKPRSEDFEIKDGEKLPIYQGDIVNDFNFDKQSRTHNANRLLIAYQRAKTTIELMQVNGEDIYTSHEALILPYEEALTKVIDSKDKKGFSEKQKYNSSAHMLWLGERTRFINSAHVEYLKTINNPIGIKISDKTDAMELIAIVKKLNTSNESGKIILISRMGTNITKALPNIIKQVKQAQLEVLWFCDCLHGNTIKIEVDNKTYKVRYTEDILAEIDSFAEILFNNDEHWAGIHLENTYLNVYECVSKVDSIEVLQQKMVNNYHTFCDPRLNYQQSMKISKHIAKLLGRFADR